MKVGDEFWLYDELLKFKGIFKQKRAHRSAKEQKENILVTAECIEVNCAMKISIVLTDNFRFHFEYLSLRLKSEDDYGGVYACEILKAFDGYEITTNEPGHTGHNCSSKFNSKDKLICKHLEQTNSDSYNKHREGLFNRFNGMMYEPSFDYFCNVTESTRKLVLQRRIQEMTYLRPYPIRHFDSVPNIHLRKRKSMENVSTLRKRTMSLTSIQSSVSTNSTTSTCRSIDVSGIVLNEVMQTIDFSNVAAGSAVASGSGANTKHLVRRTFNSLSKRIRSRKTKIVKAVNKITHYFKTNKKTENSDSDSD